MEWNLHTTLKERRRKRDSKTHTLYIFHSRSSSSLSHMPVTAAAASKLVSFIIFVYKKRFFYSSWTTQKKRRQRRANKAGTDEEYIVRKSWNDLDFFLNESSFLLHTHTFIIHREEFLIFMASCTHKIEMSCTPSRINRKKIQIIFYFFYVCKLFVLHVVSISERQHIILTVCSSFPFHDACACLAWNLFLIFSLLLLSSCWMVSCFWRILKFLCVANLLNIQCCYSRACKAHGFD